MLRLVGFFFKCELYYDARIHEHEAHMDWTESEPGNQQREVSVTTGSIAWPHISHSE
jgi:hypothetical protein